jgi:2-octaprenyl-6-methoxyphenol hydroxylase
MSRSTGSIHRGDAWQIQKNDARVGVILHFPWQFKAVMNTASEIPSADTVYDAAVVGTGPSGLVAALALQKVSASVVALGPAPKNPISSSVETRTAVLLASSVDLLKTLDVWNSLKSEAAPLKAIRIIDASRSPFRAPDIEFKASELDLEAFGYNIPNTGLVAALYARASEILPSIISASVEIITINSEKALLTLSGEAQVAARLVVGADGRNSLCRRSAGIGLSERQYDQAAIASSFKHGLPHRSVSTEFHKENGSVTAVPLPDPHASSLIWVGSRSEIATLTQLEPERFEEELGARLDGLLGSISGLGARAEFPVAGLSADTLAANRTALVGEAAHILPPIGAQGLNLGFRDAAALADCVGAALRRGGDTGGEEVLASYRRARQLDIMTRTLGVDLLSRSLLSPFLPIQAARGLVSHGLKALPPLRRMVMRLGLTPPSELPTLMRPAETEG